MRACRGDVLRLRLPARQAHVQQRKAHLGQRDAAHLLGRALVARDLLANLGQRSRAVGVKGLHRLVGGAALEQRRKGRVSGADDGCELEGVGHDFVDARFGADDGRRLGGRDREQAGGRMA